jgi:ABC-2 type transport system permease protein
VAAAVVVAAGLAGGLAAWVGSASQHGGVPLPTLLGAGLNLVPPAVLVVGVGVAAFGVAPRSTSTVVYGYLGWSLLVVVVGGIGRRDRWVLDTSVFHQMASAPATPPHWVANGVMVLLGVVAALAGGLAFARRDLEGA